MARRLARILVAFVAVALTPPAAAQPHERDELAATRLVYASGKRLPTAVPAAPGKAGEVVVVPGRGRAAGHGPLVRYSVAVEAGLPIDRLAFARTVERVLSDPRGWGDADIARFQRVGTGPTRFVVVLASRAMTDALCAPTDTNGRFSCASGDRAVLNFRRWQRGADAYSGALTRYRVYMVNHEVGHLLGHGHAGCAATGARAPVMMQQTKGVGACLPNPWPLPWERP